jgi:hypothetical protein
VIIIAMTMLSFLSPCPNRCLSSIEGSCTAEPAACSACFARRFVRAATLGCSNLAYDHRRHLCFTHSYRNIRRHSAQASYGVLLGKGCLERHVPSPSGRQGHPGLPLVPPQSPFCNLR